MTHNLIQKVFKNKFLPYKKEAMASFLEEKTKAEKSFYQAKIEMLQEMQNILWDSFGFKISISSHHQNDSYVIGTSITDLMSRRNIDQNNIYSFIEFFRKNNWDINKPVIWLEGQTPFALIISDFNAKITDVFMKESKAQFSSVALHIAASSSKKDLLDWFFENAAEYDINFKTCQGKMAIDLATDPEIIKMLFSAGATSYNAANYQDTCKVCDFLDDTDKLEQAHWIRTLLGSYFKYYYSKEQEDSEIIARFVQILSQSDDPKLLNMLKPIEHYWDHFISPLVGYYLKDFGLEKVCLPLIDEYSLYQDMFI